MQNLNRIYALSKRNIILRYKNSLVGFFWGFIKPLLYLLIFTVIFKKSSGMENYTLYVSSGLILWFFFSNVTSQAIGSIVGSAGLLKSLQMPAFFFPLSETVSELFNLGLTIAVFLGLMYWFGLVYDLRLLLILPCIVLFFTFTLGLILLLSAINVFFRDVGIIWGTIQPALFFLTPIAYPESSIDPRYKLIIEFNPIYYFIKLGRTVFYETAPPPMYLWGQCALIACGMLIVGYGVFHMLKNQFISAI